MPEGGAFSFDSPTMDCGMPTLDKWVHLQAGLCPWPVTWAGGYYGGLTPIQPYWVDDL